MMIVEIICLSPIDLTFNSLVVYKNSLAEKISKSIVRMISITHGSRIVSVANRHPFQI